MYRTVYLKAFVIGGLICIIAQLLIDLTGLTPARILSTYVCAGVILTAVGIYKPLVEFAGCGATVPLTGFGYVLAQGVKLAVIQDGLLGAVRGGLAATSAGISASICLGFIASLIFNGKPRNG